MSKKKMHYDCFNGSSNYIPLIVKVPAEPTGITNWEAMNDPQKAIDKFVGENINSLKVESDFQPIIESNFMECLIPSLFGAVAYEAPGGAIDVKPVFSDVYDLENVSVPDLMGGMMPQAIEHLKYIWSRLLKVKDIRGFYKDKGMEAEDILSLDHCDYEYSRKRLLEAIEQII